MIFGRHVDLTNAGLVPNSYSELTHTQRKRRFSNCSKSKFEACESIMSSNQDAITVKRVFACMCLPVELCLSLALLWEANGRKDSGLMQLNQ